jgi:hypothetical protein
VVEAGIRYPSDAMLALLGVRVLVREGRKVAGMIKGARRLGSGIVRVRSGGLFVRSQRRLRVALARRRRR